ncbi:PASTA domain-containing protein [Allorhizocola rhizosphaerae]|uniref:PASTA domain-containing protein n=1 Tax=Allorhizocola rhizosphaerae TaxID=1872709 RepID=UPI000E3EB60D|nr:PASTA domain-containing protein [Allorhizocola rhizosphaerae]
MAGCAAAQPVQQAGPEPSSAGSTAEHLRLAVPQVVTLPAAQADSVLTKAGLVPVLRFEPGILASEGTVVNTEPAAGTLQKMGDKVIVIVAGQPGPTLHDYVDAHREQFVGVGVDGNGVLVIGVHQSTDLGREMPVLTRLADGRALRVQSCQRTWVELRRVQVELQADPTLRGASFATALDPLACAVRFTGDVTDAQVAELTGRFSGALVIQQGSAGRLG